MYKYIGTNFIEKHVFYNIKFSQYFSKIILQLFGNVEIIHYLCVTKGEDKKSPPYSSSQIFSGRYLMVMLQK